jgi:asparagine synthase (glutamine-hydrolysing)
MCGIAGFSGHGPLADAAGVLERLAHRGPDGSGSFVSDDGSVSLFHTRLAIQDLSDRGAQPMSAANGDVVITYNGEIYNFRELRADLEGRGHHFESGTDTEVILALYLDDGPDLLQSLNGIFAFAIWDGRNQTLFVARDGMGVKPLYFSQSGDAFSFASELKALLCFPWIEREIDTTALAQYVRYLWCPSPRTPLTNIRKVMPGQAMIVRHGRIERSWEHYHLPELPPDESKGVGEWTADIRNSLETSIERQMVSDVPVGAFLSGGLDSSAVVAFARQHTASRLQCFTVDSDEDEAKRDGFIRDFPFAERVAKELDVDLHVIQARPDMADQLERMIWHLDEPQADLSAISVMQIAGLAREHGIKVLLSGAGGDDIFSGYRRHRVAAADSTLRHIPYSMRGFLGRLAGRVGSGSAVTRKTSRLLSVLAEGGSPANHYEWITRDRLRGLMSGDNQAAVLDDPLRDSLAEMRRGSSPLQMMLQLDQKYFLTDHNLNYTDKMAMAESVEVRVPFLDPDLVGLAAGIPDRYRQKGRHGKWILKKAMEGLLPDDIIYRPKTGFGVPLRSWIKGPLRSMIGDVLSKQSIKGRGVFDANAVATLIADDAAGKADHAYSILSLVCIELWCRQFVDGHG